MNEFSLSLEEYLHDPLAIKCRFVIESEVVLNSLKKMVALSCDFPIVRWVRVKKTRRLLVRESVLREFSIKLIRGISPRAYMKDSGEMFFSVGVMLFRSSLVTLKTFCHELCHMWLSEQSFYPELKAVDKEFRTKFSEHSAVNLLSPIEVYAMSLSVEVMNQIATRLKKSRRAERFARIIRDENEKLTAIKNTIIEF